MYIPEDVLAKVDSMSMAHSLEVRSLLLDHRVLEFATRLLSASSKISRRRGNVVLRTLAGRRLSQEIYALPKRRFTLPIAEWQIGELRKRVETLIIAGAMMLGLWRHAHVIAA